ncbi:DNA polymerase IV [Pedobacter deserti]|uniref:DNA polymerase IV n=1 Tax=Pedobacter deserti TaxID=2817382 RepID=UPI00210CA3A6|nr:DNA polymerase IV [Pedobacter sp. SYSU D00382]
MSRKIIHVDMDAFYASVEQRDFPELKGKPVVVGGSPSGRGVVAAASYEARKYGIKSAMPARQALQLCAEVVFVKPRFEVYKSVSAHIREIFRRYTDLIEPLSLDEAYLDVTTDKLNIGSALEIAKQIKQAIKTELNLTASAGVSTSKFVAKVASDINKPDGLTFIGPSKIEAFMEQLPVEKFYGVGKVTAKKMQSMGLHTGADLKALSQEDMTRYFGKSGAFYYNIVRGLDDRPVRTHREPKSSGTEDTFSYDLTTTQEMYTQLDKIAYSVSQRLERQSLKGRTITLKIKFSDFKLITRSKSLPVAVRDFSTILQTAMELLDEAQIDGKAVRLLGISLSNFGEFVPNQPRLSGKGFVDPDQLELEF